MSQITVVGGGLAGLTAAIACAEGGAKVRLLEAHDTLGGRARNNEGPFKANLGPHALYQDGPLWQWLAERKLLPAHVGPPLGGARFRWEGAVRRTPPLGAIPSVLRLRGRKAPVELDFRTWAASHTDERTADLLSAAAGVYTFHHDPGELSAAFVWPQTVRLFLARPPGPVRYASGGWGALVATLERRVRELGVTVETGRRVEELPEAPVILATEHEQAAVLLGVESLSWPSGRTVCLDLGLRSRRGDPWIVSDMEQAGWVGRYSTSDRAIAPAGHDLIQAQMPIRPGESTDQAGLRLERLIDASLVDWRERETWRRRQVMDARSGALDMPGKTWRDRPAVDRGDGVFLAGDMVAAPGLLAEVSLTSAVEASRLALAAASAIKPRLRRVA
jgi:glycine/D-amino acid oxidase-like deaminating enzyme